MAETGVNTEMEFGFSRPEFRKSQLAGTVELYHRHVFLCYKNPNVWPSKIEDAEVNGLPKLLAAAVTCRKADMSQKTRLTICEGENGSEPSNGDVLIFPDMIRYRKLEHSDVDTFVEEALVKDGRWMAGTPEMLKGSYVFVCCHGARDRRCGVCGPKLVSRFREEIKLHGLQDKVSISPCSHLGGHKYAGNVLIFGSNFHGDVTGHWYGYVTPDDVPALLDQHVAKGEILENLWRGRMGLSEEEQKKSQERRLEKKVSGPACKSGVETIGCCRGDGNAYSCCQTLVLPAKTANTLDADEISSSSRNNSRL